MSVLEKRIEALESAGGGRECETCGFDGDYSKLEMAVRHGPVPGPDKCPECGRPLIIRLRWGPPSL